MSTSETVFNDARAAAYTRLGTFMDAQYPTTLVQYENRNRVDIEQQREPWVSIELAFTDGEEASIEAEPVGRYSGAIYLTVWVRQNEGIAGALAIQGRLAKLFKTVRDPNLQTSVARPLPGRDWKDWHAHTLRVPMKFDDYEP